MRWTRVAAKDERRKSRTVKSCGPDASMPASSWQLTLPMTVTRKPIAEESAK
jgi:hypothetical protein